MGHDPCMGFDMQVSKQEGEEIAQQLKVASYHFLSLREVE